MTSRPWRALRASCIRPTSRAACRRITRWRDCGGEIALVPDLDLIHHAGAKAYPGNFHEFMLRQPGGSEHKEAA